MKKLFRYSSAAIIFILVLSLFSSPILSNFNTVLAQDESPTLPTEPPVVETPTPAPTQEPEATPTVEPTLPPTDEPTSPSETIPEILAPVAQGFQWSIQINGKSTAVTTTAMQTVNSLKSQGVIGEFIGSKLNLAGSRDIAQMRLAIYEGLPDGFDFLSGPVSLLITYPAEAGVEVIIRLEARNTTGFAWVLLPSSEFEFTQSAQSEFQARSRGFGVPSVQTLRVTPNFSGTGTLHLVYQRNFESDLPITTELQVNLVDAPAELDLSDPMPKSVDDKSAVIVGEESTAAFDEIPLRGVFPGSFDWRTYGVVPPVRDQGTCGSCWAFGTVGVMESAVKIGGGPLTDLSEQFLVSCNNDGWDCLGGLTANKYHFNTLAYNQATAGAVLESAMPYTNSNGTCTLVSSHPYKLSNWAFVTGSEWTVPTVDQIKSAIYTYGPITAGVCANQSNWSAYTGGVYSIDEPYATCGGSTNHQIVLVGWNDADQTWILRNSWGPSWGDDGYMHIRWNTSRVGEGTSWVKYGSGAAIPAAPTLVSPAAATVTTDDTVTFTWSSMPLAEYYDIQVDNNSDFSSPESYSNSLPTTSFTTESLDDARYYWRVRSKNMLEQSGAWSASRYFTIDTTPPAIPLLSKPLNGADFIGTPTFTWLASAGASRYQVQYEVVDDNDDETFDYRSTELTVLTHKPGVAPQFMDTLYWSVRAKDTIGNWSEWSEPFTVKVVPPVPLAPVLTAPVSGFFTNNDPPPTLAWNAVAYAETYEFWVAVTATFAEPLAQGDPNITTLNHTLDPLEQGKYYWRVRARNANNVAGAWSAYRYFTVDRESPAPPVLSKPLNGSDSIGNPTFTWLASVGAKYYQVRYDDENTFTDPIAYTSPVLTVLTHKPGVIPPLMTDTYWQVRAGDAAGNWSAWSTPPFTVRVVPPVPLKPVLTAPVSGLLTNNDTPTLTWNAVAYAETYEIQVDTTYTFLLPLAQEEHTAITELNHVIDPGLLDGKYYWRVRARNVNGVAGAWSAYRYFTIDQTPPDPPVLSKPLEGAQSIGTPTFSWLASVGAKYYQLEYARDPEFGDPEAYISPVLTVLTHKPTTIPRLMETNYWRVRAGDAAGNWSGWSSRTFSVIPPKPLAPVLASPASGYLTSNTSPSLAWNSVAYAYTYEIQVATTSTFLTPAWYIDITALNRVIDILPDGKYYWRVRARNVIDDPAVSAGAWSAARYFTVDSTEPAIPVLSKPSHLGQSIGTAAPTFTWLASVGAKYYQVRYDDDPAFADPVLYTSPATTLLTYKPNTTLVLMTTYYWQVRAGDAADNWSAWSDSFMVTAVPPVPLAPVLTSPASGLITNNNIPTLAWNTVANAISYEVQFDELSTFADPFRVVDGVLTLNHVADPYLPDGKYYWRVRGRNTNNAMGPWSVARYFTVDTTAPNAPALSLPVDNAAGVRTMPTFSWLAAATANAYQFQYDSDTAFADPVSYTSPVLTVLSHKPGLTMSIGTWYWRVRARDAVGNWGEWSTYRTLTILPPAVTNGNFEAEGASWTQYSSNGWTLISTELAHRGTYAAWLGGDISETSQLTQTGINMSGARYLHFWYVIDSGDFCGWDYAWVKINGVSVKTYNLCASTDSTGWIHQVIDLQSYTGSIVSLEFMVISDSSYISSFFVDDVSITNSSATPVTASVTTTRSAIPDRKK